MVTINDMERILSHGGVIHVSVYKNGIGGHNLLVENVTRTSDGDFSITMYDPYGDKIRTLPSKEFKKFLGRGCTVPASWRE